MIAGREDLLFDALHDVASHIAGARVYEFAGVGHSSYYENAAQFNDVLGKFLAEHMLA